MLGSQSYDKAELKKIIEGDGRNGDASLVLAGQLIAAKLNLANGSDPAPVSSTIADADALLSRFSGKLPYAAKRSSPPGEAMATDVAVLGDYNLGNLTPAASRNAFIRPARTRSLNRQSEAEGSSFSS